MRPWYLTLSLVVILGCSRPDYFVGVGGKYNAGKEEIIKRHGANLDRAIINLETVARDDPTYKDSLTLLGRAYYRRARYGDAKLILQRALVLNKNDEIAWLTIGLAQLRLGENGRGLQSIQGGLTLLSKANREGYMGYEAWDVAGKVGIAVRRAVFAAQKGLENGNKEALIKSVEVALASIDEEEFHQKFERVQVYRDQN
jgi:tetratricopeptide (TPR) repeat protein